MAVFFFNRSRFNLDLGTAETSPPPEPPRVAQGHVGVEIPLETAMEERKEGDRLTVSQLSPSKTATGCRERAENLDWNNEGSAPASGTPIAVSPMRPSRKRVSSAEHSDTEPDGARPAEWEKRCLITESNGEGGGRGGGGEEKEGQRARRVAGGEKSLLQPSRKTNGGASSSLTLTRRLKAKAVRGSPQVRKHREKLAGRVLAKGGAGRRPGAPKISRGEHAGLDVCFPGNVGASAARSAATLSRKGCDRTSLDETTGPAMPYSGDNVSIVFSWLGCKRDCLKSDEMTF
jgi:hypothetical protein